MRWRQLTSRWSSRRRAPAKRCNLCGQAVDEFGPYQGGWSAAPRLMVVLGMVGSDLDHWACPHCGAHDRERHLWMYLNRLGLLQRFVGADVLHFAPEKRLVRQLLSAGASRYVRADLYPTAPEIEKVDLLAMRFDDASFDIVIANHVIEHVADDRVALLEIRRVMRSHAFAVLQTPYCAKLAHTIEDPAVVDDEARTQLYGQADHVRLFGSDIFDRFAACGLQPAVRWHHDTLPDIDPVTWGVNPSEPLFLFHRV